MPKLPTLLAIAAGLAFGWWLASADARDRNVAMEFQRRNPCPSTGKPVGACPGWERDHIIPLCNGGADHVSNFQWLTIRQHATKTRGDVATCKATRRNTP